MKIKFSFISLLVISFFIIISSNSCKKDEVEKPENYRFNEFIYKALKTEKWYFWYDKIPEIKTEEYWNPTEFLNALIYKEFDKWSYITSEEEYNAYYEEGKYFGYGFSRAYDRNGNLRISYVFEDSPMAAAGVGRGCKLLEVNGKNVHYLTNYNLWEKELGANEAGVSCEFTLELLTGDTVDITMTKTEIFQNSILYSNIYDAGEKKVGYFVLKSFIEPTIEELNTLFTTFSQAEVTTLIVDLRYNGGGRVDVAQHLASLIAGNTAAGNVFAKIKHNSAKSSEDITIPFETKSQTININQVIAITTKNSASASEMLINGLKPFVEVKLVGDDTHGKPVGMYSFSFEGNMLIPICFESVNANNEGAYYNGITADSYCADGLEFAFGDENENCLKEALFYLENGFFNNNISAKQTTLLNHFFYTGLKAEIDAD